PRWPITARSRPAATPPSSSSAAAIARSPITGGPCLRSNGSRRSRSWDSVASTAMIAAGGAAVAARASASTSPASAVASAPRAARRLCATWTAARSPPATSNLRPASASASSILVRIMADASDDRRIGSVIAGYRIDSRIGRGGMGVVYRAHHLSLERQAALKVIAPDLAESSGFRERFSREARVAAAFSHPNIVTVYDAGEVDGTLYLAMQYVEGSDLAAMLATDGRLKPYRAIDVCRQVGDALDAAHAQGLIHRDVKPANVLIAGRNAYLTDFGLTKRVAGDNPITHAGDVVGTIHYVAPEQIEGGTVTARTDVYSLGCVLYHCLTGEVPFARDTDVGVIYAHLSEDPPRPSRVRADLPEGLDAVIA